MVRSFSPPVNGQKDPWPHVLSLSGAQVVCWRPHLAGTRQYLQSEKSPLELLLSSTCSSCLFCPLDMVNCAWVRTSFYNSTCYGVPLRSSLLIFRPLPLWKHVEMCITVNGYFLYKSLHFRCARYPLHRYENLHWIALLIRYPWLCITKAA